MLYCVEFYNSHGMNQLKAVLRKELGHKGLVYKGFLFSAALLLSISLSGCITYNLTKMVKAKNGIDEFYLNIQQQRYDDALTFYSPAFRKHTSLKEMRETLDNVTSMAGHYEGHKLVKWRAIMNDEEGSAMQLLYRVTYSRGYTIETMLVASDGKIHKHDIVLVDESGKEVPLIAI